MQFGRFHAAALLILGLLLLMVQVYVVFEARSNVTRTSPPDQTTQTGPDTPFARPHRIDYLPGVLGLGLVAFGGYVMVQGKKRPEPENPRDLKTHDSSHGLTRHM